MIKYVSLSVALICSLIGSTSFAEPQPSQTQPQSPSQSPSPSQNQLDAQPQTQPPVQAQPHGETQLPFPVTIAPTVDEQTLAPLLDLSNGGHSVGAAQGAGATLGSLPDGTELPKSGPGFVNVAGPKSDWGSGLMISYLVQSAPVMAAQAPGTVVYVGAIAQPGGGPYAPHQSHQNGLDADILFMGAKNYDSMLDKNGVVTSRFDPEKNWFYWRLATSQQIRDAKGKAATAVSMILIDPRLKTFVCAWAKSRETTLDALDMEVLSKLRPTAGHDGHFHLRFKCSPHYASCINGGESRSTLTGCTEFDPAPKP